MVAEVVVANRPMWSTKTMMWTMTMKKLKKTIEIDSTTSRQRLTAH
jgi:hypothetical protein